MLVALPACLPPAHAADHWAVMTDSGARTATSLEFSADGTSLVCRDASNSSEALPLTSVAALMQRTTPPSPSVTAERKRFFAVLSSGERLLAESVTLETGQVTIAHSRWGHVPFKVQSVRRLTAHDSRLADPPADFTGVRYFNGDSVPGTVSSIARETVLVDMEAIGKIPVEGLSNVADVVFTRDSAVAAATRETEILLRTGEILRGRLAGAGKRVEVRTSWAAKPLGIPLEMISALLFSDGRTLVSYMTPKSAAETPFLGFQRPWQRDRSLTGNTLSTGGFAASRGLALHSKTVLEFAIPPSAHTSALIAWTGIDDAIPPGTTFAELQIAVDNVPVETLRLRPAAGLFPLRIEIPTNAAALTFTADYGEFGSVGDHVDILYPCLVTRKNAP